MESPNINRDAVLKSLALNETNSEGQPRKRRRLDNLTAEERALRRKLKNRVAAQTARDRKKARMQDLEDAVKRLERDNKSLRETNKRLQKHTDTLSTENSELRIRLGLTPPVSPEASPSSVSLPPSPEPSIKDDSDDGQVVIKKEIESKEFAALTASQQQKNLILFLLVITTWLRINTRQVLNTMSQLFVGLFEDDDSSSDDDEELLEPKQERNSMSSCCQKSNGRSFRIKSGRDQDIQAIPQGIDGMVGSPTDDIESIDEILGYKNLSMELDELDVEPGTLGDSGINVWEESFTDLFPSLMTV
ncbi:hypothetical protein QZH41_012826 [Actinostola sp. cb2023]|nr:hypothetical protein QZH41_012826 [Actinostola sp. cb2023]